MDDKISQISQFTSEASKYTNEVSVILKDVLAKIKPSADLKAEKHDIAKCLLAEIKKLGKHAEIVGSLAKDTDLAYTAYDTDIDIFIKFPVRFKKDDLGKIVIEIGEKILTDCEIDYAEHPYIKGKFKNFSIELVPCYDFGEGIFGDFKNIATSVDRTIYHTKYVKEKIEKMEKMEKIEKTSNKISLNDEIRLLKQFMKGCNVYGAEASVKGFSGYLAELMCIYSGSFINVIKGASKWKLNTFIDIENQWEGQGKILFDEPLIVIDPVDKNRNVASAVSEENMAKFIYACRKFLLSPSIDFFISAKKKEKSTKEEILSAIKERGTKFIAIRYEHQYININNLYPQLEKTRKTLIKQTEKFKFCVMNSKSYTSKDCTKSLMLFEFEIFELPNVEIVIGPPIDTSLADQESFINKHGQRKLNGWRWIATQERKFKNAVDCLKFLLSQRHGFGKEFVNLDGKIEEDEEILKEPEIIEILKEML